MAVGFRTGKHRGYQKWWSGAGKRWRWGTVLGVWSWRTGFVYKRMSSCTRRLHSAKCWGGKKQCFCNEDEYANYERGHDYTLKKCLMCCLKRREILPPLRGMEKHGLLETTRKADEVLNETEVGNITELNDIVFAGALVVTEILGVKIRKSARMEP